MPEDEDDESYDLSQDGRDEDPADTIECPACGASIYEEAECCPDCGKYIVADLRTPRWVVWTAALGVIVILVVWLGLPWTLWRALTGR